MQPFRREGSLIDALNRMKIRATEMDKGDSSLTATLI